MSGDHPTMYLDDPSMNSLVAKAEYESFAPAPCTCYSPCVAAGARQRTYWAVYGNRSEMNQPIAPFMCLTQDICIADCTQVWYFDKPFHVSGPAPAPFCCLPFTCCGPPVIYSFTPKFLCIDLSSCFGQQIKQAPCNCFGLKVCEWKCARVGAWVVVMHNNTLFRKHHVLDCFFGIYAPPSRRAPPRLRACALFLFE